MNNLKSAVYLVEIKQTVFSQLKKMGVTFKLEKQK